MKLGMAMIVKNDIATIRDAVESFVEHIDVLAVLDTGSTDGTPAMACAVASTSERKPECLLETFEWVDDFSVARTRADELLAVAGCDVFVWVDADDVIRNAQNLRALAEDMLEQGVNALGADYEYATHPESGRVVVLLKRERIVRAGAGTWVGRIHEGQLIEQPVAWLDNAQIAWVHRKPWELITQSSERNRLYLQRWTDEEPGNHRAWTYLGTEYQAIGDYKKALECFERYFALGPSPWPDEGSQTHRKASQVLTALGRLDEAKQHGALALVATPLWPDGALTLAEVAFHQSRWDEGIHWAQEVLRTGVPETLLIIDPSDYTARPHIILAGCLDEQGQTELALKHAQTALQIMPDDQSAQHAVVRLQTKLKRDTVARQWVTAAQLLVSHDEQAKALVLLEQTCPYFVQDHPEVVMARTAVRERLVWTVDDKGFSGHYITGGSKPEDFHDDERALQLAGALPRTHYLAEGLREQALENATRQEAAVA